MYVVNKRNASNTNGGITSEYEKMLHNQRYTRQRIPFIGGLPFLNIIHNKDSFAKASKNHSRRLQNAVSKAQLQVHQSRMTKERLKNVLSQKNLLRTNANIIVNNAFWWTDGPKKVRSNLTKKNVTKSIS